MTTILRSYRMESIWLLSLLLVAGAYAFAPSASARMANCHYDVPSNWCWYQPEYNCLCDI